MCPGKYGQAVDGCAGIEGFNEYWLPAESEVTSKFLFVIW
jgi:hypothetical protein